MKKRKYCKKSQTMLTLSIKMDNEDKKSCITLIMLVSYQCLADTYVTSDVARIGSMVGFGPANAL